jgi:hypothetical protein
LGEQTPRLAGEAGLGGAAEEQMDQKRAVLEEISLQEPNRQDVALAHDFVTAGATFQNDPALDGEGAHSQALV